MKIAIVTAVWKRPEVFEMFAKGIQALLPLAEICVIVSGSEGEKSRQMVESKGFVYVEMPNEPLACKVNAATLKAQTFNPDYVLCMGSDDIISPELFSIYLQYAKEKIDFIGVTDFYFYDIISKKALYWAGYREAYRKGHTAGAGRMISARLMDIWGWAPWEIKHSKILDNSMQDKLKVTGHSEAVFSMKEMGVYALDIKSETNMTQFAMWDNTVEIDAEEIKSKFPYIV